MAKQDLSNSPISLFQHHLRNAAGTGWTRFTRHPIWQRLYDSVLFNRIVFAFFCLAATALLTLTVNSLPSEIHEGDIAVKDIRANRNYEIPDKRSTEKLRQDAVDAVLPVYDWNTKKTEEALDKLGRLFAAASEKWLKRDPAKESPRKNGGGAMTDTEKNDFKQSLEQSSGIDLSDKVFGILLAHRFSPEILKRVAPLLRDTLAQPIIAADNSDDLAHIPQITVQHVSKSGNDFEEAWDDFGQVLPIEDVKHNFSHKIAEMLEEIPATSPAFKKAEAHDLAAWFGEFITPTFEPNHPETELRKQKALETVKDVIIKVKVGEVIVRAGDRFNSWHKTVLEGIRNAHIETNGLIKFLGTLSLFLLVTLSLYSFSKRYVKRFQLSFKDVYFIELALLIGLIVLRVGGWLAVSVRDTLPISIETNALYYTIPIAGIAMLARMILSGEVSLLFSILLSLLGGFYLGGSIDLALYYFVSCLVGTYAVSYADKRLSIMKAGLFSGLAGAAMILGLRMITVLSIAGDIAWSALLATLFFAIVAGLISGVLAMSLPPIAEFLFHYTTDIKLLELANLNHPLLREMIVRAPGTYHHSHLVGILAEAGARAIGANALLARVACYYHDIGKMKQPEYFIENQRGGRNRHDKLNPSESAAHIAAHVEDGLEMARRYKLPPCIVDMIPQHQGTKIMTYFYEKAKSAAGPHAHIDETHYRYPGPKPQSREAGIIMLADATEAAVRSLPEKSKEAIESLVKRLMNRHFSDGQFDECELTLKDLHLITQSFTHVLMGIYHNRIPYPDSPEEEKSERIFVLHGGKV